MPVVGGDYLSMRNGPVTSEFLDLINEGRLYQEPDTRWEECITDRQNHEVALLRTLEREQVSNTEVKLMDEIWAAHGPRINGNWWTGAMTTAKNGPSSPALGKNASEI